MIGKRCLKIVETLILATAVCRITTLHWDPKTNVLTAARPRTKLLFSRLQVERLGFKMMNTLILGKFIFGGFGILGAIYIDKMSFQDIMFQVFILSIYLLGCIVSLNNAVRLDEVAKVYNIFIRCEKQMTEIYQTRAVRDRALPLIAFILTLGMCELPAIVVLYMINFDKPVYFGCLQLLIPKQYLTIRILAFLFFLILEILGMISVVLGALLYASVFILFLQSARFWVAEVSLHINKADPARTRGTDDKIRDFVTVMRVYRSWQLVIKRMNEVPDIALCGQHFVVPLLLILCAFSTIEFWGWHNFESIQTLISYLIFPAAVLIFSVWIILIQPQAAEVKVACIEFRKSWALDFLRTELGVVQGEKKRLLRSSHDLDVHVGQFFSYQVSTMPQVMDECVDKTITLLLG